jgi:hypothetical protein
MGTVTQSLTHGFRFFVYFATLTRTIHLTDRPTAYDPNNARYRELSSSFWKTYTTYGGLWRDQPLWAYFLYHFNVTPAVMTTKGTITKGGDLFQTGGKLGWGKHIYT